MPVDTHFTDVTRDLGLPGLAGGCLGLADFDGDGQPDLLLSSMTAAGGGDGFMPGPVVIYHNPGDGHFPSTPTASLGQGFLAMCATGDIDRDGRMDVVMGGPAGISGGMALSVFYNRGGLKFDKVDVDMPPGLTDRMLLGFGLFDYDNDGWIDLIMGRFNGGGSMDCHFLTDPQDPSDTHFDYVCESQQLPGNPPPIIFRNDGTGKLIAKTGMLQPPFPGTSNAIAFADFDGDNTIDIVMMNDWYSNHLLLQKSVGNFVHAEQQTGFYQFNHGMGAAINDYDLDGILDIFGADLGPDNLWFGQPGGTFKNENKACGISAATTYQSGWAPIGEDFDNDGLPDVFVASSAVVANDEQMQLVATVVPIHDPPQQYSLVFWNKGARTFDPSIIPHRSEGQPDPKVILGASAAADIDGDGDLDVVVASGGQMQFQLLRNDSPQDNNWLTIRLVGKKSNPSGMGARVELLKSGMVAQTRIMSPQGSVGSSWHRVHFGLGHDTAADVRVHWPSGQVQDVSAAPANQPLVITEPQ